MPSHDTRPAHQFVRGLLVTRRRSIFTALSAVLAIPLVILSQTAPAAAVTAGGGLLLYGQASQTTPKIRMLKGVSGAWSDEGALASISSIPQQTIVRMSPTRTEAIAGIVTTGGTLNILRWDGYSWSTQWTTTTGLGNTPRFDIAYEQSSGQAVVVYSKNAASSSELAYRVWTPGTSTWTSETTYTTSRTTGIVQSVQMTSRAGSDDLAMAWEDANFDLSANWWNGSTNAWTGEPSIAYSTNVSKVGSATSITNTSYGLAFEQTSGRLMLVWGNDATTDMFSAIRGAGSSGTWATLATTNSAFVSEPTDVHVASEPGTNYIAYANATDSATTEEVGIWNGTAWTPSTADTSINTVAAGTTNTSVGWLISGTNSRAVVTYDDSAAAGIDWDVYNKSSNSWALQTDYTTAPTTSGTNDLEEQIYMNPQSTSSFMYYAVDSSLSLFAKRLTLSGTTLSWTNTEPNSVALNTAMPAATAGWISGFDWVYVAPASGLGVDIVDASDASVASPTLSFTSVNASPSCQTSTATLGAASQKIRLRNFTSTPGWTLSIAATNGTTSTWTSGLDTYDYNDPSGSGCTSGTDGDGLAGQLSINPSVSTVTPDSTCLATNLTKGSSSAFSSGITSSITLLSASTSASYDCYFDMTGIALSQTIPSTVMPGSYSLNLTLTAVAN